MNTREQEYNKYLRKLAENLDISDTMRDKAIESYSLPLADGLGIAQMILLWK